MTVKNRDLWVIGTGPHSQHYLKVLQSLYVAALIVGRSKEGCEKFQRNMGTEAYVGGLQKAQTTVMLALYCKYHFKSC